MKKRNSSRVSAKIKSSLLIGALTDEDIDSSTINNSSGNEATIGNFHVVGKYLLRINETNFYVLCNKLKE